MGWTFAKKTPGVAGRSLTAPPNWYRHREHAA
jgi:hypothetical protein